MTFDLQNQRGGVSVSSNIKAVIVELGMGDRAGSAIVAFTFTFTFTSTGKCVSGSPKPTAP